jgi:hypothetical protein
MVRVAQPATAARSAGPRRFSVVVTMDLKIAAVIRFG